MKTIYIDISPRNHSEIGVIGTNSAIERGHHLVKYDDSYSQIHLRGDGDLTSPLSQVTLWKTHGDWG
jgi:hypothetical protein